MSHLTSLLSHILYFRGTLLFPPGSLSAPLSAPEAERMFCLGREGFSEAVALCGVALVGVCLSRTRVRRAEPEQCVGKEWGTKRGIRTILDIEGDDDIIVLNRILQLI